MAVFFLYLFVPLNSERFFKLILESRNGGFPGRWKIDFVNSKGMPLSSMKSLLYDDLTYSGWIDNSVLFSYEKNITSSFIAGEDIVAVINTEHCKEKKVLLDSDDITVSYEYPSFLSGSHGNVRLYSTAYSSYSYIKHVDLDCAN